MRALLAPPFMHGAAHWMSFRTWNTRQHRLCAVGDPNDLDPCDIWSLVEREQITFLLIVGDAIRPTPARRTRPPRVRPVEPQRRPVGRSAPQRPLQGRADRPHARPCWSSTASAHRRPEDSSHSYPPARGSTSGTFPATPGNHVLSEDLARELAPGDPELGWLAKSGRLALGYLGDATKTAATYPVIDGVRYAVPGDRGEAPLPTALIELHGRDSVTINSGGEKIFAEEVELAVKRHHPASTTASSPAGRASDGATRSVAVVRLERAGVDRHADAGLLAEAACHIARYKLPATCSCAATNRSTSTPPCCGCDPRSDPRTATASMGSSGRRPLLVSRHGDVVRSRTPSPARPLASAIPPPTPGWRPSSSPPPRTRSSTASSSKRCMTPCCQWCSYLIGSPNHQSCRWPTCSTWARSSRDGSPIPRLMCSSIVQALCPTPALGGYPRAEALALITRPSKASSGRYGGSVGWVDADGNGAWAVAIRCADCVPIARRPRLFAGGGIVADSDPLSELAETQAKFQANFPACFGNVR